jgi:hypothetical protein
MLLLFSSGARPRYRDDIVRALALPRGAELQFRYERAIVSDSLLARFQGNELRDENGLISYLWINPTLREVKFVPCRFVSVLSSEVVGTSHIIRLEMHEFAALDEPTLRASLGPEDLQLIPSWPDGNSSPTHLAGKFLFEAHVSNLTGSYNLAAFETVVSALAKFEHFKDHKTVFYTVRGIVDLDAKVSEHWPGSFVQPRRTVYHLAAGNRYEIEVYCFSPIQVVYSDIDTSVIHLNSESEEIEFSSVKSHQVDSEYDIKRFRFFTASRPDTFSSALRLYITRAATEKEPSNSAAPHRAEPPSTSGGVTANSAAEEIADIVLPVRFHGALALSVVRALLITIGTAGPAMVAANTAGKLTLAVSAAMLGIGLAAGFGAVFTSLRRP